jgi:BolA protein
MDPQKVENLIREEVPEAQIDVVRDDHEDERSDGAHFGLVVISDEFEGMSRVDRHRVVHEALGEELGGDIHAVEIRAQTHEEATDG